MTIGFKSQPGSLQGSGAVIRKGDKEKTESKDSKQKGK